MKIEEKKIVAEYILETSPEISNLALYRFSDLVKKLKPKEISYKPLSGYTEIKIEFPNTNISAIKLKQLNSSFITYKALPTKSSNYYYPKVEGNRILLKKISAVYLFDPAHQYYSVNFHNLVLKKAESREELEHRKKSINFKLRNIENEEARILSFEDAPDAKKSNISLNDTIETCDSHEVITNNESEKIPDILIKKPVDHVKIEEVVRRIRIVNMGVLMEKYGNPDMVKNFLFKMTDKIAGRFILKNMYYERRLHNTRSRLLDMFRLSGEVKITETFFLNTEQWIADEIANKVGMKYVLKGYCEKVDFDASIIENVNKKLIDEVISKHFMLGCREISQFTGIDDDIINLIVNENDYIHLANNGITMDDSSYWFNSVLKILSRKKSIELDEVINILNDNQVEYEQDAVVGELKIFCNQRGKKYFLKIIK